MFRNKLFGLLIIILLPVASNAMPTDHDKMISTNSHQIATFAGGCFWCVESDFDKVPGVIKTISGYIGGEQDNPSYKQVSAGLTSHAEAVQITFDPKRVSYKQLLETFWRSIDPTTSNAQFCDHGDQYRTAIFYHGDEQFKLAEKSRSALNISKPFKKPIVTEIIQASEFFPAEKYHQDYYIKNPLRYKYYRYSCGRDQRLTELWGKG